MCGNVKITTEDDDEIVVDYSIIKNDVSEKPYGIYACVRGSKGNDAVAEQRFFTYAEAIATVGMLCRNQVTPCTLCDVI